MPKSTSVNFFTAATSSLDISRVTAQQIKLLYESNPDVNQFTDILLEKLNGILDNAVDASYVDAEVQAQLSNLFGVLTMETINLTPVPLEHGDTLDYSTIDTQSSILIICRDTNNDNIDSIFLPLSFIDTGIKILFFNESDIFIQKTAEGLLTFDTTGFDANTARFNLYAFRYTPVDKTDIVIDGGTF